MKHHFLPLIGHWYYEVEQNLSFEVIAIDDEQGLIALQYYSGEFDELDDNSWNELSLITTPPPEDGSNRLNLMPIKDSYIEDYYHQGLQLFQND
tara:strand:- start:63 stop:344 length:282 start_codon:yes stop_codon:yes gene_type:complete